MQDGQHLKIIKILIKAYLFCIYCYLFISLLATITSDPHAYFCSASLELLFCFVLLCNVITYFIHSYSPCQYYSFLLTFVGAILLALLDSLLLILWSRLHCHLIFRLTLFIYCFSLCWINWHVSWLRQSDHYCLLLF